MWSKRKAYFILARIVRAKDTREGVEQEKGCFLPTWSEGKRGNLAQVQKEEKYIYRYGTLAYSTTGGTHTPGAK